MGDTLKRSILIHLVLGTLNFMWGFCILVTKGHPGSFRRTARILFLVFNIALHLSWAYFNQECIMTVWEKQKMYPNYVAGKCPGVCPSRLSHSVWFELGTIILLQMVFLTMLLLDFEELPLEWRLVIAIIDVVIVVRRIHCIFWGSWTMDPFCQHLQTELNRSWNNKRYIS